MSTEFTFNCWNCKKSSKYSHPAETKDTVFRWMGSEDREETRTYYCEHCQKANEITLRASVWPLVAGGHHG